MKRKKVVINGERGFAIVEATLIFPVVFLVVFFIIFFGNIYFMIAEMDDIGMRNCIHAAQAIADPWHYDAVTMVNCEQQRQQYLEHGGNEEDEEYRNLGNEFRESGQRMVDIGTPVNPYRYIFGEIPGGSSDKIEKNIKNDIKEEVNNKMLFFWDSMKLKEEDCEVMVEYKNYLVYSKMIVDIKYQIPFPIQIFGGDTPTVFKRNTHAEVAVNDSPEFIRNVDMVADILDSTRVGEAIASTFKKVGNFLKKVSGGGTK